MAEEKKAKKAEGEHKEKAPKKHLHQIIHTFAHDGSASHEHVYKKHKDDHETEPARFMGTSQHIDDLMQHDQDHAGPAMAGGEGEGAGGGEPEGDEAAAGGGAGAAGAAAGGAGEPAEA